MPSLCEGIFIARRTLEENPRGNLKIGHYKGGENRANFASLRSWSAACRADTGNEKGARLGRRPLHSLEFLAGSVRFQFQVFDGEIPVSVQDLEAALLFFFVGFLIGVQLLDQ
jgi:hypothetical protein